MFFFFFFFVLFVFFDSFVLDLVNRRLGFVDGLTVFGCGVSSILGFLDFPDKCSHIDGDGNSISSSLVSVSVSLCLGDDLDIIVSGKKL